MSKENESFVAQGEERFLENYNINDYERPSVTTDIAVFSIHKEQEDCYRKNPELRLKILLVKRGIPPFVGKWALPGGFLKPDENIYDCALRKIKEETGVVPVSLMPVGAFSDPGRDPRGWIISNAFTFVVSEEQISVVTGAGESEVAWFDVSFESVGNEGYSLVLSYGDDELSASLSETDFKFGFKKFEIVESCGLAFDHAKIIASALSTLRAASQNVRVALDFLPEKFTLAALQKVQETLTGESLIAANFRRKISELVEETSEFKEGAGHRPARLYRRR